MAEDGAPTSFRKDCAREAEVEDAGGSLEDFVLDLGTLAEGGRVEEAAGDGDGCGGGKGSGVEQDKRCDEAYVNIALQPIWSVQHRQGHPAKRSQRQIMKRSTQL